MSMKKNYGLFSRNIYEILRDVFKVLRYSHVDI